MRITLKGGKIFGMAGLFDKAPWKESAYLYDPHNYKPNELMADIHDRMPVILRPEDEEMRAYQVSSKVGNVKNDGPECIVEIVT